MSSPALGCANPRDLAACRRCSRRCHVACPVECAGRRAARRNSYRLRNISARGVRRSRPINACSGVLGTFRAARGSLSWRALSSDQVRIAVGSFEIGWRGSTAARACGKRNIVAVDANRAGRRRYDRAPTPWSVLTFLLIRRRPSHDWTAFPRRSVRASLWLMRASPTKPCRHAVPDGLALWRISRSSSSVGRRPWCRHEAVHRRRWAS